MQIRYPLDLSSVASSGVASFGSSLLSGALSVKSPVSDSVAISISVTGSDSVVISISVAVSSFAPIFFDFSLPQPTRHPANASIKNANNTFLILLSDFTMFIFSDTPCPFHMSLSIQDLIFHNHLTHFR